MVDGLFARLVSPWSWSGTLNSNSKFVGVMLKSSGFHGTGRMNKINWQNANLLLGGKPCLFLIGLLESHGLGYIGGQGHLDSLAVVPRIHHNLRDQVAVSVLSLLILKNKSYKNEL